MSLLCLVTDRQRLVPAGAGAGAGPDQSLEALGHQIRAAAMAGVDLIQVREPDLDASVLTSLVARAVALTRGSHTRILVNDRADVALAAGAGGVHLRATSMSAAELRRITPRGFLIGRSVHGLAEAVAAQQAGGLDYLILGTVFPSRSKPASHRTIGVEEVARVVEQATVPILPIGGVTLERAADLAAAGAGGVAGIGLFEPVAGESEEVTKRMAELVVQLRLLFDTHGKVPYHKRG